MPADRDTPRERVVAAAGQYGESVVALWAAGLLAGEVAHDDPGHPPMSVLGGRHAVALLAEPGYVESTDQLYWPRTWGARALLYAWDDDAAPAVRSGLADPAWRVREMSAKVARRRELGEAGDLLAGLAADAVPRVRAAAVRALGAVGEAEHADAVHAAGDDQDEAVRRAARLALQELRRRLDRDV